MTAATPEPDNVTVDSLWEQYWQSPSTEGRNGLVLHYAPLVKFVAGRLRSGLPASVESQDLIAYGTIGLIESVDRYQPNHNTRFETFAAYRIRGAMIDELRRTDWAPRSVRKTLREIREGLADLEHILQRTATEEELAAHLDMDLGRLRSSLGEIATLGVVGLETRIGDDGGYNLADMLADPAATDPERVVEAESMRESLVGAIRGLPKREQTVIGLYYFQGLTLKQIGVTLSVTEARISQIHTKAVLSLRNRLISITA